MSSAQLPKLFVVIPAFNEAGSIAKVIDEVRALESKDFEINCVVVDDGSRDQTRIVAQKTGTTVIALPYNMGIGLSVQTGFQFALSRHAQYVVQVDGDGQHIAAEIPKLFQKLKEASADVVIGTRFFEGSKDGLHTTTFLRWLVGRALASIVHFLTGKKLTDTTSGFRLFSKNAAEYVANHYPDDYPEVQVLVALVTHGYCVEEVSVKMRSRTHGASSINWWRSLYYVFKVVFASVMDKFRIKNLKGKNKNGS